mmetsp:Transcript_15811/g.19277  ORF Transcript_15811/g.19277 Transcript_15811/m.19277 type:complete len:525 (-) Transcript_15811:130-1704(-)
MYNNNEKGHDDTDENESSSLLQHRNTQIIESSKCHDDGSNSSSEITSSTLLWSDDDHQHYDYSSLEEKKALHTNDKNLEENVSNGSSFDASEHEGDHLNGNKDVGLRDVSYVGILLSNRPFRFYLLSYVISHAGEWFTYVASIELIEQILGEQSSSSRKYISYLVICRLIPNIILFPLAGILADVRDRRESMICLDCIAALAPLLFLVAFHFMSIPIILLVTLLQASIAAFYEPCRSAILPLLVPQEEEMKKATTLTGLAWSVMAAVGSGLGGIMVSKIGIKACFILDTFSFIVSVLILIQMGGKWDASIQSAADVHLIQKMQEMVVGGANYIMQSNFWPYVFIKLTSSLIYGGADVLNVSFSEEGPENTEAENSKRLGELFISVGLGCLIGPLIADHWTSMKNTNTIVNSCVASNAVQGIGLFGMGYFKPFYCTAIFTLLRSAASSIAWIDSSVLLQTYSRPDMLGRVMALDYGLALAGESVSAMLAGILQDNFGMSAMEVSNVFGGVAFFLFILWSLHAYCF